MPGVTPLGSWAPGGIKLALRNLFIIVDGVTLMAASQDSELAPSHARAECFFRKGSVLVADRMDFIGVEGFYTVLWSWLLTHQFQLKQQK